MVARRGTLEVVTPFDSRVLTRSLPIEVRNQHHTLVATITDERNVKLPEGLYSVTAVLDNGQRVTESVQVKHRQTSRVSFRSEPTARDAALELDGSWFVSPVRDAANAFVATLFSETTVDYFALADLLRPPPDSADGRQIWIAATSPNLSVSQSEPHVMRARLVGESQLCWIVIASTSGVVYAALPLSRNAGCDECTLSVHHASTGKLEVKIALSSARQVGRALHGLIETGKVGLGLDLSRATLGSLAGEHADPISAVYGALMLQRAGLLKERAKPVESLARQFPWIPDARILRAALLSRSRQAAQVRHGHLLLLEATRASPMFSDAFSLALTLLRRWPDKAGELERRTRLEALAGTVAHCDFNATFTTMQWSSTEIAVRTTRTTAVAATTDVDLHVLRWLAQLIVGRYVKSNTPADRILEVFAAENRAVVAVLGDTGVTALLQVLRTEYDVELGVLFAWPLVEDTPGNTDLEEQLESIRDEIATLRTTLATQQFGPAVRLSPADEARLRKNISEAYEARLRS